MLEPGVARVWEMNCRRAGMGGMGRAGGARLTHGKRELRAAGLGSGRPRGALVSGAPLGPRGGDGAGLAWGRDRWTHGRAMARERLKTRTTGQAVSGKTDEGWGQLTSRSSHEGATRVSLHPYLR